MEVGSEKLFMYIQPVYTSPIGHLKEWLVEETIMFLSFGFKRVMMKVGLGINAILIT